MTREKDFPRICKSIIESPPADSLHIFQSLKMLVELARRTISTPTSAQFICQFIGLMHKIAHFFSSGQVVNRPNAGHHQSCHAIR